MSENKVHNLVLIGIFLCVLSLFCYFRLKPIQFQTVPYTYDQGRDFLKAQEIIHDRNLTFIGPTTGINGVFHGAWWFYVLTIPYVIFGGNPIGFYYFVFFLMIFQVLLFSYFLKKEFNIATALSFLLITTTSPYFISVSFFSSNSILALPFILLLFFATYYIFKSKKPIFLFLIFLGIGFILESELAFGLFIIPAYILTIIITKNISFFFGSRKKLAYSMFGFLIPVMPRILFEIKNHFAQTKHFIYFFVHPTETNPVSLKGALIDRSQLFLGYYKVLFFENNRYLMYLFSIIIIVGLILLYKKISKIHRKVGLFNATLLILLFLITLISHSNFFWGNYLEGLPYFYLSLTLIVIYTITNSKNNYLKFSLLAFFCWLLIISGTAAYRDYQKHELPHDIGLRAQRMAVEYIYKKENRNNFCVHIYTPPVIPFTYRYLFSYYATIYKSNEPSDSYVNNSCWYMIEHDDNKERRQKWVDENIPKKITKTDLYSIDNFVTIFKLTKNDH